MNIIILDGYTLNPGDLSWEGLKELGEVTIYDRTSEDQIIERAMDSGIILTNKTPISKRILDQLPALKYIGVLATGYNNIDIPAAKEKGVVVTNIPSYGTHSVAQQTIALLLELTNQVAVHANAVREGEWTRSSDWCFRKTPLTELFGKNLGIIGHGLIGQQVGKIATAMGMQVLSVERENSPIRSLYGEKYVSIDELLSDSDVVSLHCPLTTDTEGMINRRNIEKMKDGVLILNTSRGGLVMEHELAEALHSGKVAGAGLDVLSKEPPDEDHPLLHAPRCMITPHAAWLTKEARMRLLHICVDNVRAFLQHEPINVI